MSLLKSCIGSKSDHYREEVTPDRIESFCRSVGADSEKGAPPTFMTVFRKGEFSLFEKMDLELSRALHAEQEYEFQGQIRAGDRIQYQTEVTQVLEKQGSTHRMQFVTFETSFEVERNSHWTPVGKARSTVIFRE